MLRDVAHRRRATAPRAAARPAAPAPSRQPARDPLLDRARRDGLGAPVRRAGGLAGRRARRRPLAGARARAHRGPRRGPPDAHAALALRGPPLGGCARRRLHAVGLVRPGAAHRSGVAGPDRRHRARPARAAVRAVERDGDDGVCRGRTRDQGPRPRGRRPARRRPDGHRRARRRGRHVTTAEDSWRRLSARMLLVHPVQELVRALPWLFGLLIAGSSSGRGGQWGLAGVGLAILAGIMRWFTTSYRITPEQVQLQSGLLRRRLRAVALDRVRTVDVTANAMHRILGLTRVTVGTGRSDGGADAGLRLDGLDAAEATTLRDELLHRRAGPGADDATAAAVVEGELARPQPAGGAHGPLPPSGAFTPRLLPGLAAK